MAATQWNTEGANKAAEMAHYKFPVIVVVPMKLQYKHVHEKHSQVVKAEADPGVLNATIAGTQPPRRVSGTGPPAKLLCIASSAALRGALPGGRGYMRQQARRGQGRCSSPGV